MNDKLSEALAYISDRHITEAAAGRKKRRYLWLGGIAAALAAVILLNLPALSLALQVKAVSTAEYPDYQQAGSSSVTESVRNQLNAFFTDSMRQSLSGTEDANQAYSPINLYMAMALTAELAGGSSRQQILDILCADTIESLRSQASTVWNACYRDAGDQALLANSLWLDESLHYSQSVMDTLASTYYTSVYQSDLGSRKTNRAIQAWLDQQTGGLLKSEARQVSIPPETVLAVYSTVYYQAKWSDSVKFSSSNNSQGLFHTSGGDVECTFMNKEKMQTAYYWGADFGAVALSLKDGSRMWLILPDPDKTVEDVLASGEYAQIVLDFASTYEMESDHHKYVKVNLSVPKFDVREKSDLREALEAMGVTDIFDPEAADFSDSVDADTPLWITSVNQATRVAIDEEGVTAASYIELPLAGAAAPPEEIVDFILDRPFLFVITNRYFLPLFAGVVNDP